MSHRRVAGAQDHVVLDVRTQLGVQRGANVDLGEDAEPVPGQDLANPRNGLVERKVEGQRRTRLALSSVESAVAEPVLCGA